MKEKNILLNQNSNKKSELINKDIKYTEGNVLPQYQILVDSAKENSNQRENSNKFYLTLIAALFGIVTFLFNYNPLFPIIPLFLIITICSIWLKHLKEYKLLNEVKFELINELENYLPVKAYTEEWKRLNNKGYSGLTKWNAITAKGIRGIAIIIIIVLILWQYPSIVVYIQNIFPEFL